MVRDIIREMVDRERLVSVLRGRLAEVRGFAEAVASKRGVHSAQLHVIPARIATEEHAHGAHKRRHEHVEL